MFCTVSDDAELPLVPSERVAELPSEAVWLVRSLVARAKCRKSVLAVCCTSELELLTFCVIRSFSTAVSPMSELML